MYPAYQFDLELTAEDRMFRYCVAYRDVGQGREQERKLYST